MTEQDHLLIERYLDDLLAPNERASFVDRLDADRALRDQLDLAEQLTASLRRSFVIPQNAEPTETTHDTSGRAVSGRIWPRRIGRTLAAAAAAIAIGVAVKLNLPPPAPVYSTLLERTYSNFESTGFTPEWVCETDEEFAAAVRDQFGQPMLVDVGIGVGTGVGDDTPAIELLGWAYTEDTSGYGDTIISDDSMILLTRVQGQGVLVIVDRVEDEREPMTIGETLGLSLFRRVLGDLVLYEVTPRDGPSVLERAYTPAG